MSFLSRIRLFLPTVRSSPAFPLVAFHLRPITSPFIALISNRSTLVNGEGPTKRQSDYERLWTDVNNNDQRMRTGKETMKDDVETSENETRTMGGCKMNAFVSRTIFFVKVKVVLNNLGIKR